MTKIFGTRIASNTINRMEASTTKTGNEFDRLYVSNQTVAMHATYLIFCDNKEKKSTNA